MQYLTKGFLLLSLFVISLAACNSEKNTEKAEAKKEVVETKVERIISLMVPLLSFYLH